ncbi:MAG: hypothetical protein H8E72_01750 [Candidatus Marinimicrobia bacterium]|nr:hypothetical protein [Candidatus Neomarinimicrobiota bacterium]
MIQSNKVGIFFIGLFILFVGCENDPLELTPSNCQTLTRTIFTLSSESSSVQDSVLIGSSKTLYSGYVDDGKLSTILLSLDYDNLQEHPICIYDEDTLKNIENIQFEFKSLQALMDSDSNLFVDTTALSLGFSSANIWNEDVDINSAGFSEFDWEIETILDSVSFTENSIIITIDESSQLLEWCSAQDQYLIISYSPDLATLEAGKLKLIEFYSSEFTISHRPQISFDYSELKATEKSTNKFIIESINSDLSESSVHIVNNIESEAWSRIYVLNVSDDLETNLDSSIVTYDLNYNEKPIIDSELLDQEFKILKLTITLNDEIIDSIDTFGLSILDNSIIAYSNSTDLAADNFSTDTLGTEGNSIFDQGEEFLDFGLDQCPDQFEDGNSGCLVLLSEFSSTDFNCIATDESEADPSCIYNSLGTEGNGVLDWEDVEDEAGNLNGIWNDGEGEKWDDVGSDGCTDEFEDGDGDCLETQSPDYVLDSDPNGDNYNIDPSGDDYDELENPSGTEGNDTWEESEPFFDIGCDGIPQIIDVDGSQGNGVHDECEPFNDTGVDGLYSYQEIGYNSTGTQNNTIYNSGESTDAGKGDGCLNKFEDAEGGCLDIENSEYIDGTDPNGDDYIVDPNSDNEDGDGNGVIDWTDANEDGSYNIVYEIGEYFYDFGSDGVSDADEVFSESNFLSIGTGTNEGLNDYPISKNTTESFSYEMPDISTNDAILWVSNIRPIENNQFELTFSVYAEKELKSISFSLTHKKLEWVDTTFVSQSFDSNDYTAKFIDDISAYAVDSINDESQLSLNYGYVITSKIDFVNTESDISLSRFIDDNRNVLLSNTNTQLVLPIDTENSMIDEFGANLILSGVILDALQPLISINISQNDEHINIPMSTLLQKYINGQYVNFDGFELSLDGSKYNFSNIIIKDSAYLEIVYSK